MPLLWKVKLEATRTRDIIQFIPELVEKSVGLNYYRWATTGNSLQFIKCTQIFEYKFFSVASQNYTERWVIHYTLPMSNDRLPFQNNLVLDIDPTDTFPKFGRRNFDLQFHQMIK